MPKHPALATELPQSVSDVAGGLVVSGYFWLPGVPLEPIEEEPQTAQTLSDFCFPLVGYVSSGPDPHKYEPHP